jgi:hypothetical protein
MIITKAEDTFLDTLKTTPLETLMKSKNYTRFIEEIPKVNLKHVFVHKADKDCICAKTGRLCEILFIVWMTRNGRVFEEAKKNKQLKHIDFTIITDKIKRTVDVKAPKRWCRKNFLINLDPSIIWVEFINRQGGKGWLYGKCNFFAFYQPLNNGFYVVRRTDLVGLCEELCSTDYVKCSKDAMYNLYQKENALDATSIIKFTDLQKIPYFVYSLGDDFWDNFSVEDWQKAHPKKAA